MRFYAALIAFVLPTGPVLHGCSEEEPTEAGSGAGGTSGACSGLCSAARKVTSCPNEDAVSRCNQQCASMLPIIDCAQARSYFACIEQLGESAYECTATGAVLRSDACATERLATSRCTTDGGPPNRYGSCSSAADCPITMPECLTPQGNPGMCSRSCETDINCPPGDHCVGNSPAGIPGRCFAGCETKLSGGVALRRLEHRPQHEPDLCSS